MKVECVIFDCDGLMFDTEKVSIRNWHEIAAKYDITLDDLFFQKIIGCNQQTILKIFNDYPDIAAHQDEIFATRVEKIFACCKNTGSLNKKGLIPLLDTLDEMNIRKCVASSSNRHYVDTLLNSIGKEVKFDAVVCGDEVKKGKPDPEIFLTAAAKAGVDPQSCLVLEDSKSGILAARNAGMKSVWIYDTVIPDEEMKEALQISCHDLSEVIPLLKEEL